MLIKASLIVAILASIGALVISHLQVASKIDTLKSDLETTSNNLKTSQTAEETAKKDAREAKALAEKTSKDLAETNTKLEGETARATQQEGRAGRAEKELDKTKAELTEANRDLAAWKALGRPVDQIEKSLAELAKATEAISALGEEKKVMSRRLNQIQVELAKYQSDKDAPPELPAGLKGKIVAVDPKWDFVVLDIGSNQGLVQRGELLVNRDGKLVAKVRVTTVDANRAIANVLPEWKQVDVQAGDTVLH